ncbi:MAG: hypothetical protein OHK0039_06320 [Bacteroidia bacterium]
MLLCAYGQAQTFTTVGAVTNPGGTCYCLNQSGQGATAIWADAGLDLSDFQRNSITLIQEYEVYLGSDDGGGHGIAFVIQQEGTAAIGSAGNPLGYGGSNPISPSVAVEIDTSPQGFDGTTEDHMAIVFNGNHNGTPAAGPVDLPNVEDGAYHSLRIEWQYRSADPATSTLMVIFDGTDTIIDAFDPAQTFDAVNPIYFGFTGGINAAASNDQKVSFGAIGSPGTCSSLSLPVELMHFSASMLASGQIDLRWATASELNNDYFEILRSGDTRAWERIGRIDGAGSTQSVQYYAYTDRSPLGSKAYYQLRQVDYDGAWTLSPIVEVLPGATGEVLLTAYPNPATDRLYLDLQGSLRDGATVGLVDMLGRSVYLHHIDASAGSLVVEVPIAHCRSGLYHAVYTHLDQRVHRLVQVLP